ncbi:hypothetical protein ACFL2H_02815 [Planctomycetota bacterium]
MIVVAILSIGCSTTNASDRSDFESAARQFRIRAYQKHRTNRDEYDRQIEQSRQLLQRVEDGELSVTKAIRWLRGVGATAAVQTPTRLDRPIRQPMQSKRPFDQAGSMKGSSTELEGSSQNNRVAVSEPLVTRETSTRHVSIDLDVLAARIESTNLELETIDAQLHPDAQRLFPDELAALADDLERAMRQHELSQTYVDVLSFPQRARVPAISPVEPVVASLSQQLFDAQIQVHRRKAAIGKDDDFKDIETLRILAHRIRSWQNH